MNRRLQSRSTSGQMLRPASLLVFSAMFAGAGMTQDMGQDTTQNTAQGTGAAFELQPGVVIDKDRGIAFVMNPKGGTDALAIASGEILWHSNDAGRPVAVIEDQLVAQVESSQAGSLELVMIDADSGAVLKTASTALPTGTVARVSNGMGSSFRSWAEIQGGQLAIGWEASKRQLKGTGSAPPQRAASGALLDVSTGTLEPTSKIPAQPKRDREMQSASKLAAVSGRQFLSADGEHVLASEMLEDRWGYRWALFGQDGTPIGQIESTVSYAPFFVAGSVVVYPLPPGARKEGTQLISFPLRLQAVDLESGAELWTREIRDTTFRGPYPP